MLEGVIDDNVPSFVKNIFPNQTFLIPNGKPGIYVCFFPNISKVYIGQSKNIVEELKRLISTKEKRPHIIQAFRTNNKSVKKICLASRFTLFLRKGTPKFRIRVHQKSGRKT